MGHRVESPALSFLPFSFLENPLLSSLPPIWICAYNKIGKRKLFELLCQSCIVKIQKHAAKVRSHGFKTGKYTVFKIKHISHNNSLCWKHSEEFQTKEINIWWTVFFNISFSWLTWIQMCDRPLLDSQLRCCLSGSRWSRRTGRGRR